MNTLRDTDAVVGSWLDDGPRTMPAETRDTITVGIRAVTQRRSRIAWPFVGRGLPTSMPRRRAVALPGAVLLVAAAAGLTFYAGVTTVGDETLPTTQADWSRSPLELSHVHAITEGGPGLVAVGGRTAEDDKAFTTSDDLAVIWTSSDGRTWSPVAQELGRGVINDVASGGPGLVAVGYAGSVQAAVWTSLDGLSWSRVPDGPVFKSARIQAVSVGGPGLVAVGFHHRAWFSSDGLTWELASVPPVPPDVYPGDDGATPQVYLTDVAAAGDRLVAVGWSMLNDNSDVAILWTSADGTTWSDVPLDPDVFPRGSSLTSVTGGPSGFLAIGLAGRGGQAAMWTSADGVGWHRVGSDQDPFGASRSDGEASLVSLNSVTAGSAGYVAVGGEAPCAQVQGCASFEAAVWTSTDGTSWVRIPTGREFRPDGPADPDRGTSAHRVVPWGSGFVVWGEYDGDSAVWISEPLPD